MFGIFANGSWPAEQHYITNLGYESFLFLFLVFLTLIVEFLVLKFITDVDDGKLFVGVAVGNVASFLAGLIFLSVVLGPAEVIGLGAIHPFIFLGLVIMFIIVVVSYMTKGDI